MRLALLAAFMVAACARPMHVKEPPLTRSECGEGKGWRYCIYSDSSGKPSDTVLYYLHGGGDSELQWGTWPVAADLARRFRDKGLPAPNVVSISFGKQWLLTERGTTIGAGLLERFVEEAMPAAEAKLGRPRRRLLWGLSMGGFNAAQLLLKRPALWQAAVLSCPAVNGLDPSATDKERHEYASRTGASFEKIDATLILERRSFPSRAAWERHDPLHLAQEAAELPPTLIECGDADEWGFYEGSRRLSETLAAQGQRVRFDTIARGRHCAVDPDQVLGFLLRSARD